MVVLKRRSFSKALVGAAAVSSFPSVVLGQSTVVSTVAGIGEAGYEVEGRGGALALESPINNP